jgi:integrase
VAAQCHAWRRVPPFPKPRSDYDYELGAELEELGIESLSERVTPHALRRTYASLGFALRDDPVYVAEQLGHTEATFSMAVYAKAVKRRERLSGAYLREYDRALEWAQGQRVGEGGRLAHES